MDTCSSTREPERDDTTATLASEPASNPEHVRAASRRAREGRIEACSLQAALRATERNEVINTKAQDAELRLLAVCDLIDALPSYCLAFTCDVPEERRGLYILSVCTNTAELGLYMHSACTNTVRAWPVYEPWTPSPSTSSKPGKSSRDQVRRHRHHVRRHEH